MSNCVENGAVSTEFTRVGERRPVTVVIGTQWGDEGKGKIVDMLAVDADLCCRCQGGNNAGHSVHVQEKHYAFHLIPSGVINPTCTGIIGNGVVINLPELFNEIDSNAIDELEKRLVISDRAHLVFDLHRKVDGKLESDRDQKPKNDTADKGISPIGTTNKGIGPTYSSKATRNGLRICDLIGDFHKFDEKFRHLVQHYQQMYRDLDVDIESELRKYENLRERVRPMVKETVSYLHKAVRENKRILVECAQSTILDIDFGLYPFVTSSNCSVGGVCTGLGIPPHVVGEVYGVVKAYLTRVGSGGFPTEQNNEDGERLQKIGAEFGVTTGRKRRCGWLDLTMLKYSNMINGFTGLAVTKLDVLDDFETIKVGVAYKLNGNILDTFPASDDDLRKIEVEYKVLPGWKTSTQAVRKFSDLPDNAQKYIHFIEKQIEVPVRWVGVGRDRDSIISIPPRIAGYTQNC